METKRWGQKEEEFRDLKKEKKEEEFITGKFDGEKY